MYYWACFFTFNVMLVIVISNVQKLFFHCKVG